MAENKLSLTFEGNDKDQLVAGLAALVCADGGDLANIVAVAKASGNTLAASYGDVYAKGISAEEEGIDKFCPKPGSGGGGGGGGGGADAAAAAPAEEPKKEEEEVDFSGGMDMFGGGGGGGGDY